MNHAAQHDEADASTLPALVTRRALARETRLARRTVDRIIAEQAVPIVRPGVRWDYLRRDDFERALASYTRTLSVPKPAAPTERAAEIAERVRAVREKRAERAAKAAAPKTERRTRGASKPRAARRAAGTDRIQGAT
jgi:hypothetical protein